MTDPSLPKSYASVKTRYHRVVRQAIDWFCLKNGYTSFNIGILLLFDKSKYFNEWHFDTVATNFLKPTTRRLSDKPKCSKFRHSQIESAKSCIASSSNS